MPNCHSMPPELWAEARETLVYYFSSRHGSHRAEDLAHETLAAILSREDFEFEQDGDFLRVCLGFARFVSKAGFRQTQRDLAHVDIDLEPSISNHADGARATEARIMLQQVVDLGRSQMRDQDWQLLLKAALRDGDSDDLSPLERNRFRVTLHRARRKLKEITARRRR